MKTTLKNIKLFLLVICILALSNITKAAPEPACPIEVISYYAKLKINIDRSVTVIEYTNKYNIPLNWEFSDVMTHFG